MTAKKTKASDWIDDTVAVSRLNLDLQNPRIPKHIKAHNDEKLIRNYLLEKEDVLRIARNIAINGYHKSVVSITYRENSKLIVLDGNRRLAACQLLLKPELSPNAKDKKALEELTKKLDGKALERIKITIAPSRKDAEKEIWDIHVNQLLKPWQVLQKLRMYRNLIDSGDYNITVASKEYGIPESRFKKELGRLYFYEKLLEQVDEKGEEELQGDGFNRIDRLIVSTNGEKLLKYSINDEGNVQFENEKNANNKLTKLIPFIIGNKKIPAQATQQQLVEDVYSKIDPVTFPPKKAPKKKKGTKTKTKTKKGVDGHENLAFQKRRNSRKYLPEDAKEIVEYILVHLDTVAEQLLDRYSNRATLKVTDEYDVQDLLHSILAMFFDDVVDEAVTPSGGGSSSRIDFLLLDNGTVIETKSTLTMQGNSNAIRQRLERELNDDLIKYSSHPKSKHIYYYVYDPEKKIKKPTTLERALTHNKVIGITVKTIINRG
jgi:hypothetical protein